MSATVRGVSVEGRSGSLDEQFKREYTVVYKVTTTDPLDGSSVALSAAGVPEIGDIYAVGNDVDADAVVTSISVSQGESPNEWELEATYSTETEGEDQDPNPLLKPPDLSFGSATRRSLLFGAFTSAASPNANQDFEVGVLAPNGEAFDPQPEADFSEPILTIKRNLQLDPAVFLSVADSVNSDPFLGAFPRQWKFNAPTAVEKYHKLVGNYWEVTFQIAYRWTTWDIQILNQGSYYWDGGKPDDITSADPDIKRDTSGKPLIVNLTANGDINTTGTPTFTRIRYYREISFNSLGLL